MDRAMRLLNAILLLLLAGSARAQFYAKERLAVNNGEELVRLLGSDRTLQLGAQRLEVPAGIIINGFRNLRILGSTNGSTEIVAVGGAAVLTLTNCYNVDLRRLTIRMESSATTGVMSLISTTNVQLRECSLAGVAATGLILRRAARLNLRDCTVMNCGAGMISAVDSGNVLVENCRFARNEGPRGFNLQRFFDLRLKRCGFTENTFKTELVGLTGGHVRIEACRFTDNRYPRTSPPGSDVRITTESER